MATEPCYSPSRGGTQDFQRCPRLYDLKKRWQGSEDPGLSKWKPEIVMGNAIHMGLATHYQNIATGEAKNLYDAARQVLDSGWQEGIGTGEIHVSAAYDIVVKCIKEALKIDLLGETGGVLAVEQEMGPEQCHPDLVLCYTLPDEHPAFDVWLQVIDWKFSLTLKPEWVAKRLASYETLWQLKHYAWRVEQEFVLPCRQVTVVQMAALPKPAAWRVDYEITPETLEAWERSAQQWWNLMASGFNAQNYDGCRKYGENNLCEFYAGCHTLAGDESRFDTVYQRRTA